MKLWDKGIKPDNAVIEFTSGRDRESDNLFAGWDIAGTMAHVLMLHKVNLLTGEEKTLLMKGLHDLFLKFQEGNLVVGKGIEDIHSQVEMELSSSCGQAGQKVHTGRSRNDQVLVDIRLYTRAGIDRTAHNVFKLFTTLQLLSEKNRDVLIPGYTHLQPAMVSSFGLLFGGYAEALADDLVILDGARKINNRSPLGTAAGYGTTLPIDRQYTSDLLGFESIVFNSSYASINRGKVEMAVASALASVANTLSKLAMDITLFMSAEFRFVEFPDELVTGSSIMPQKKNPDVFELIRASCNSIMALPNETGMIINNLPSGYNRDLQLLKPRIFGAFSLITECIDIMSLMLDNIIVRRNILDSPLYINIHSTEEVNRMVKQGVPFREAYRTVAGRLKEGTFMPASLSDYTHQGSIGNLCNDEIRKRAEELIDRFNSPAVEEVERKLMLLV